MKIEMMLPVYASAKFVADIEVEGKSNEEIFEEFLDEAAPNGYLCHQCARVIESDFEWTDYVDNPENKHEFIEDISNRLEE